MELPGHAPGWFQVCVGCAAGLGCGQVRLLGRTHPPVSAVPSSTNGAVWTCDLRAGLLAVRQRRGQLWRLLLLPRTRKAAAVCARCWMVCWLTLLQRCRLQACVTPKQTLSGAADLQEIRPAADIRPVPWCRRLHSTLFLHVLRQPSGLRLSGVMQEQSAWDGMVAAQKWSFYFLV